MASPTRSDSGVAGRRTAAPSTTAALAAGVLMVVVGVGDLLNGIAAVARDTVYVETPGYLYELDLTAWGWIHVGLGALLVVTGIGVVKGWMWARLSGLGLAALSLTANFLFLPYAPAWSIVIIVIDVVIMWALATDAREI
jgi:hypothetical protein